MTPSAPPSDAARFAALFEDHHPVVLAYAARRSATEADAEDIAAETFAIAWRKIAVVPAEPLPWLYGTARRVLANHRRAGTRYARLPWHIGDDTPSPMLAGEDRDTPALTALGRLPAPDQELLRLVAWEELGNIAIAEVLGISVNAVAIRLHRARRRFAEALQRTSAEGAMKDSVATRTYTQ